MTRCRNSWPRWKAGSHAFSFSSGLAAEDSHDPCADPSRGPHRARQRRLRRNLPADQPGPGGVGHRQHPGGHVRPRRRRGGRRRRRSRRRRQDPPRVGGDAVEPDDEDHRHRGARQAGARRRRPPGGGQHLRLARTCRPRWPSAPTSWCTPPPSTSAATPTSWAARSWSTTRSWPRRSASCSSPSAPSPARWTPSSPPAASRPSASGWTGTATTPRPWPNGCWSAPRWRPCCTRACPSHPGHELAKKQMKKFGGMISVQFKGGEAAARTVAEITSVFTLAESLGGIESLMNYPSEMTHASVKGTELAVPVNLIRLSCGIEDVEDLIADLEHAFTFLADGQLAAGDHLAPGGFAHHPRLARDGGRRCRRRRRPGGPVLRVHPADERLRGVLLRRQPGAADRRDRRQRALRAAGRAAVHVPAVRRAAVRGCWRRSASVPAASFSSRRRWPAPPLCRRGWRGTTSGSAAGRTPSPTGGSGPWRSRGRRRSCCWAPGGTPSTSARSTSS